MYMSFPVACGSLRGMFTSHWRASSGPTGGSWSGLGSARRTKRLAAGLGTTEGCPPQLSVPDDKDQLLVSA